MRVSVLVALALAPALLLRPEFEPVQPGLLAEGGALVNAWADHDGDGAPDLVLGVVPRDHRGGVLVVRVGGG